MTTSQPHLSILIRAPPSASSRRPSEVSFLAGTTVSGRLDIEIPVLNGVHVERGIGQISIELVGREEIVTRNEWISQPLVQLKKVFQGTGLPPTQACHDIHFGAGAERQGLGAGRRYQPGRKDDIWVAREGKSSFPFSFTLPNSLPSSFSLHPTTSASAPKSSTRATISYVLIGRLIFATGLPTSPRLNEIFTRRDIIVISTDVLSPRLDTENEDDDNEWEHPQREVSTMKVSTRTHLIDRNQGGSIALDVQMGTEEGCWVTEGDEVGLRIGIKNGCRGIWTGAPSLKLVRKTRLHLGMDHETGEHKIEEINLVCIDEVYEDVIYRVPPLNNTSFELSFTLPTGLRTTLHSTTVSEDPKKEDHIECSFEVVVRVGVDVDAREGIEKTEVTVKLPLWIFNPYHSPYRLQPSHFPTKYYKHSLASSSIHGYQPLQHSPARPSVHEVFPAPPSAVEEGWLNSPMQYHQPSEISSSFPQSEEVDPYTPQPSYAFDPFIPQPHQEHFPNEWTPYSLPTDLEPSPISPDSSIPFSTGPKIVHPSSYGITPLPPSMEFENTERAHSRPLPWPDERGYSGGMTLAEGWVEGVESDGRGGGVDDNQQHLDSSPIHQGYPYRSSNPSTSTPSTPKRDWEPPSAGTQIGGSPLRSRIGTQLASSPTFIGASFNNNVPHSPGNGHSPSRRGINGPRPLPIPPPAISQSPQRYQQPILHQTQVPVIPSYHAHSQSSSINSHILSPTPPAPPPPEPFPQRIITPPLQSPRPRAFVEVGIDYIPQPPSSERYEQGRAVSPVVEMLEGMVLGE